MNYFIQLNSNYNKKKALIAERRNRKMILNNFNLGKKFTRGDILTINFWVTSYSYHFEGLCLSLKNKKITKPNITINLRNILYGIGIEIMASFFFNRLFINTYMSDYKRKNFNYRASKLYYLRQKENRASKVKT